ncbi:MAG: hypothetical protein PHE83_16515 [Opitutaceae bacterium]|nr:hypothetical protein [Opitutaceae bacterium]
MALCFLGCVLEKDWDLLFAAPGGNRVEMGSRPCAGRADERGLPPALHSAGWSLKFATMRPQVLLVFQTRLDESAVMLKGIAQYERSHRPWAVFLDDEARAESDTRWLRSKKWHGVISRHTTPALVENCAALRVPLVDLNDTPLFSGVPKIRPDNVGGGHLGAEHFIERGYRHFGFCGFANEGWSCERRDGFVEALRLMSSTSNGRDASPRSGMPNRPPHSPPGCAACPGRWRSWCAAIYARCR